MFSPEVAASGGAPIPHGVGTRRSPSRDYPQGERWHPSRAAFLREGLRVPGCTLKCCLKDSHLGEVEVGETTAASCAEFLPVTH